MLFNSIDFLIFFPIVVLLYYLIPQRFRYLWLLGCSYYFYMCWNAKYALLLLASTLITYFSGLLLEKTVSDKKKQRKLIVGGSFVLNLSILFFWKYIDFFLQNLQKIMRYAGMELSFSSFDLVLPVGISFYIFQALSYTMDVYRGKVKAERNPLRYALFVSFFPQLVAGPIERTPNLLKQFYEKHPFHFDNVKNSLLLMGWGYFMKMVIADRIAIFVDKVYGNYLLYGGWYLIIATVLFAFQIYFDFSGYSTIAIGAAGVMGFKITDNFRSPYCAVSMKDFWGRWHISLTSWFRDYLYIPLGGNRRGKFRKHINQMIVFLVSGLWHGAMWSYVVWGGLNGFFLVLGEIIAPARNKMKKILGWKPEAESNKILSAVITFALVDFTWLFFRSSGMEEAMLILRNMIQVKNIGILFDGSLYTLGLDQRNFILMILSILLLMIVDICHNRGFSIRKWIASQNLWFRWLTYILLFESILIFGIWGVGYNKAAFIYFQF